MNQGHHFHIDPVYLIHFLFYCLIVIFSTRSNKLGLIKKKKRSDTSTSADSINIKSKRNMSQHGSLIDECRHTAAIRVLTRKERERKMGIMQIAGVATATDSNRGHFMSLTSQDKDGCVCQIVPPPPLLTSNYTVCQVITLQLSNLTVVCRRRYDRASSLCHV